MSYINQIMKYLKEGIDIPSLLSSDEAYKILDSSGNDLTSWCAGGCAMLAFALNKLFNYDIYVIYNTDSKRVEHFIAKNQNGKYVDCDGEHVNIIKDFKKREIVKGNLEILKYNSNMDIGDIIIDKKTINTLVRYLKSKID